MRVFFFALFLIAFANNSVYGYLGSFEGGDGYEYGAPMGINLGDNDVTRYNAGQFGTNNGGPGGAVVLITPDTGLWRAVAGGRLLNQANDYYVIQHSAPGGHTSPNVLGMTTGNSGFVGVDSFYEYDFEARDFDGNSPASLATTSVAVQFWWCPQNVTASTLTSPGATIQFQDSAGNNWFEIGSYTTNESISYRIGGGPWVAAGFDSSSNFSDFDRVDLNFDLAADTVSFSFFETVASTNHSVLTNAALGGNMDYLAHMGLSMKAENTKNFLDDFDFCITEAPLSALQAGGTLWSGDKQFSDFSYHGGGDMPAAEDIFVKAITDADGNFGIRFQGAFVDAVGGGASDALIDYTVTAPDGKLIKDVNLAANPLVIGGANSTGLVSITETFLPDNDQTVLSVFDIKPGSRKLTDSADLVDENGDLAPVKELHVQKDILVWSQSLGSAATLSFIDQTFSQCDADPMNPGACLMTMHPGDFNGDGVVDAADYVVWRKGLGSIYTPNDYEVWRENFGSTWSIGAGSLSDTAVPEPGAMVLMILAAASWCLPRRRVA